SIYRDKQTVTGILFCIPVFILSGFEHSVADIFYFAASGIVSLKAFCFICIVILGNSIGGMLLPAIAKIGKKTEKPDT
ncbi:MAG: formate/nitrite transporter family protein, partial [Alphaproteobacteria bacterium]|nr:formate/nitrite transporter family protein [Alphaproteobacteria bacterium]